MAGKEASHELIARRFRAMGLDAVGLVGGRCVVARMRLQRTVFETPGPSLRIESVTLASVGRDRAKCLEPRALFQLPIVRIQDCRDATEVEARIHLAWQRHVARIGRAEGWLRRLGVQTRLDEERSLLSFGVAGEDPAARARSVDANRVILPSPGPLSGIPLQRADDRVLGVDRTIDTAVDLEIQISTRLEELVRLDARLAQESRIDSVREERATPRAAVDHQPIVLAVGPRITQEQSCLESLRYRGYQVEVAPSERDAISTFDRCSPELVLTDVSLGRSEGIDLIQSLRNVPGIEEVPVILIDGHRREDRREAARRMGAAAYLTYPVDISRIAERLSQIVRDPKRRRFTRYPQRLPVHIEGGGEPLLTDTIGRGGMFLATEDELPEDALHDCRVALPEIGADLRVDAEILYRARTGRAERPGLGVRFNAFPNSDEPVLIEYLRNLHPQAPLADF